MTISSAGASTCVPTAAILPSWTSTAPPRIAGPAAVITVTLRMTIGFDAGAWYVEGKGSSFGDDRPPRPGGGFLSPDLSVLSDDCTLDAERADGVCAAS